VERGLRFGGRRSRSDALEVLSHLGERESARLLVLLFEPGALDPKLDAVAGALRAPATVDEVFEQAAHSGDRWLEAARAHEAAASVTSFPPRYLSMADAARGYARAGETATALSLYQRLQAEAPDVELPAHVRARLRELAYAGSASS